MTENHREVWVKVNAPVDEGIADLVSALNEIGGLETLASCQGHGPQCPAYVIFRLGEWRDCGEFLFEKLLAAMDTDLRSDVALSIMAYDTTHCRGRISMPPEAVGTVARLVTSVRKCAYSRFL